MGAGGLFACEHDGGLADAVGSSLAPLDFGGVSLVEDVNHVSINSDSTVNFLDIVLEAS